MKVLLDTNALMIPVQFGIDLFGNLREILGSFEPVTVPGVIMELEGISRGKGRDSAAARVGLMITEQCTLVGTEARHDLSADEQIVQYAADTGSIVVTNDQELRNTLHQRGVDVISMRNRKQMQLLRA
ncbi:MAG: nucleotide-binding protein [Methanomicrobiaceae archaeon]|nr:nucleotide-binding protein [Methanomicrobiaceae archaeon]